MDHDAIAAAISGGFEGWSAFSLAWACGLRVVPACIEGAALSGRTINCGAMRSDERERVIAECLATWALRERDMIANREDVSAVARAIMLPREAFLCAARVLNTDELLKHYAALPHDFVMARAAELGLSEPLRNAS
jgi:hypothetical protein